MKTIPFIVLSVALASGGIHAAVLVSKPLFQPPNNNVLLNSNDVTSADGVPEQQTADNFVVSGGGTARYVQWNGMYAFSPTDGTVARPFEISFFIDNGGLPSSTAVNTQTVNVAGAVVAANTFGDIYQYGATISDVVLDPGTTYWIAVREADPGTSLELPNRELWQWHISQAVTGETSAARNEFPSGAFQSWAGTDEARGEMAFSIFDTVIPEPGTSTLLVVSLGGLALRRKRDI